MTSSDEFGRLREVVLADSGLQDELLAVRDIEAFAERVAQIAEELGLAVCAGDVTEELRAARRAWLERWI